MKSWINEIHAAETEIVFLLIPGYVFDRFICSLFWSSRRILADSFRMRSCVNYLWSKCARLSGRLYALTSVTHVCSRKTTMIKRLTIVCVCKYSQLECFCRNNKINKKWDFMKKGFKSHISLIVSQSWEHVG